MSSDYNYDNEGSLYPFFVATITLVVVAPLTYNVLQPTRELVKSISNQYFKPDDFNIIQAQKSKQKKKSRKTKRIVAVVLGWALIAFMIYLITFLPQSARTTIYDPYKILDISTSATIKQINSKYKKLALKFHPDKIRPTANQTIEDLNHAFTELTKAYKSLTDDEIRENYIQYGHPDGKQGYSIGIALPTFIVERGEFLLGTYALLLAVLLPYLVGKWWYGTQRMSKDGIVLESANNMFLAYEENATVADVLATVSKAVEFKDIVKKDLPASLENKILSNLSPKEREKVEELQGTERQTLLLLWAYLYRVDLQDASFKASAYECAVTARQLNTAFTTIILAFGNTVPLLSNFATTQCLLQAVPPKSSPLAQLPYITPNLASDMSTNTNTTVQSFMSIPEDQRRTLATGKGLAEESYKTAIEVSKQIPAFKVDKAFFKVVGEKHITIGSLVSLVIKGRFIPPGTDIPEVKDSQLLDIDPEEGVIENADEKKTYQPKLFAPYYAGAYIPKWHALLTDSKQDKIVVPPFAFAEFDQPIYDEAGNPTLNVQTLKAQFQAPPQAGQYTFCLHVIADSYIGFDTKFDITLSVDEITTTDPVIVEDEISEPEEDSLAGQMQAMKGGAVKPAKKSKDSDSDDESNTDDDQDDDESATDTDTDEE